MCVRVLFCWTNACDPLDCVVMERVNKPETDRGDIISPLHPECCAVLHASWFSSAFDSDLQGKGFSGKDL